MKYIVFFDTQLNKSENRNYFLAATNKVEYICNAIVRNCNNIEIISPAWTKNTRGIYKSKSYNLTEKISVKFFSSFGASNVVMRRFRYYFSLVQLFFYLR